MSIFLGIDIGTSSLRAALVDADKAEIIAVAGKEYPLCRPQAGYAEQNPDDWWQATIETVQEVIRVSGQKDIAAIGFSGQMHGTVLLDESGRVVHPAIIWADQRSSKQVQELLDTVGEEDYVAQAGTLPAAGFLSTTLFWLKQHQPEILNQASQVILPKDYVRYRMTGQIATEVSDAASTGIFDIYQQEWASQIIESVGLPDSLFPPILRSYDIAGELSASAAQAFGLKAGIPVIAGCADQPAQAIGNGILKPGLASVAVSSGGQVFLPVQPDSVGVLHTDRRIHVFNHASSGWYALGAVLSAGLSLRWLRDLLGMSEQKNAYQQLSIEAEKVDAGSDGLIFLPYLNGERTPHMDSSARGAFIGLAGHHSRGHMARAIMEGVAFAMRQALEVCESVGEPAEKIIASGGGLESAVWRQVFTDVLNRPLQKSLQKEQSALGAGILAAVGIRYFVPDGDIESNFAAIQPKLARYDDAKEAQNAAFHEERYQHFCELYPRLKADFHRLS